MAEPGRDGRASDEREDAGEVTDGSTGAVDEPADAVDERTGAGDEPADPAAGSDESTDALRAELAVLREENERLRDAYAATHRTRHRQAALGFGLIGVVALVGAVAFPDERTVLLALGATGLFAGLLTVYLTPERFVAASVGRSVYEAMADGVEAIVTELGLADERWYVPLGESGRECLFVPQYRDDDLPQPDVLSEAFVVPADDAGRGLSLRPTGAPLVDEYERVASGGLAGEPGPLARGLGEALVEQFELLSSADVEVEPGRATLAATDSAFGDCRRFDHPVASVMGCGLARGLGQPVVVDVRASEDARTDWLVTCRWDAHRESDESDSR